MGLRYLPVLAIRVWVFLWQWEQDMKLDLDAHAPSIRDIADGVFTSNAQVFNALDVLEANGILVWSRHRSGQRMGRGFRGIRRVPPRKVEIGVGDRAVLVEMD